MNSRQGEEKSRPRAPSDWKEGKNAMDDRTVTPPVKRKTRQRHPRAMNEKNGSALIPQPTRDGLPSPHPFYIGGASLTYPIDSNKQAGIASEFFFFLHHSHRPSFCFYLLNQKHWRREASERACDHLYLAFYLNDGKAGRRDGGGRIGNYSWEESFVGKGYGRRESIISPSCFLLVYCRCGWERGGGGKDGPSIYDEL